ncbi:12977_t:CDS:2 [Entrophospora sp. SA101]|nr:12977_t:CDS:2 [Entrophospora sp. SA101]
MVMVAVTLMMILITMMDDFDANEVIPKREGTSELHFSDATTCVRTKICM